MHFIIFQFLIFSVYSDDENEIDRKIIVKFKEDSLAAKLLEEGGIKKFENSGLANIESFNIDESNLVLKYNIYGEVKGKNLKNRFNRANIISNSQISEIEKRGFVKFDVRPWETNGEAIDRIKTIYGKDIDTRFFFFLGL